MSRRVRIIATAPFAKALARLKKKYPHVVDDLEFLTDRLTQGDTPGDQVPGAGYTVYKTRLRNTDARHGQSGGYRVLYYIRTLEVVYLLYIHTKAETEVLSISFIRRIIEDID